MHSVCLSEHSGLNLLVVLEWSIHELYRQQHPFPLHKIGAEVCREPRCPIPSPQPQFFGCGVASTSSLPVRPSVQHARCTKKDGFALRKCHRFAVYEPSFHGLHVACFNAACKSGPLRRNTRTYSQQQSYRPWFPIDVSDCVRVLRRDPDRLPCLPGTTINLHQKERAYANEEECFVRVRSCLGLGWPSSRRGLT